MSHKPSKLERDVEILAAMGGEMNEYLRHEVLFWPLTQGNMPRLTLGGFFLRVHRLTALSLLLTPAEQNQVRQAMDEFAAASQGYTVIVEQKAHEEIATRLRQWQATLREWQEAVPTAPVYAANIEGRAILAALLARMSLPPFQLDPQLTERMKGLDQLLRGRWRSGSFVWPEEWLPAYPQESYWWLYGLPG